MAESEDASMDRIGRETDLSQTRPGYRATIRDLQRAIGTRRLLPRFPLVRRQPPRAALLSRLESQPPAPILISRNPGGALIDGGYRRRRPDLLDRARDLRRSVRSGRRCPPIE
jgi:hypothetical protein